MSIPLARITSRTLPHLAACILASGLVACGGDCPDYKPAPPPVEAPGLTYDVIPLSLGGRPEQGFVTPRGINAEGKVAGRVEAADGKLHAFLYDGNSVLDLGTMGGISSEANAINQGGQVVGWVRLETSWRAFRYDGTMHDLGTLGGADAFAHDINDRGQIVGRSTAADGVEHAFFYDNGVMKQMKVPGITSAAWAINAGSQVVGDYNAANFLQSGFIALACECAKGLGTLGGAESNAVAVNDAGEVVGVSDTGVGAQRHAFLYRDGTMKDLGTFGGERSFATAINAAGRVAGHAQTKGGDDHAFLYDGSTLKDLGTLGGASSTAVAMNASSQVVGGADTAAGGPSHAMSWTQAGGLVDLNTRIPRAPAGTVLRIALAISDNGDIVAQGNTGLVLLKLRQGP